MCWCSVHNSQHMSESPDSVMKTMLANAATYSAAGEYTRFRGEIMAIGIGACQ